MITYNRNQGDSLWLDITCDSIGGIDGIWTNWSGKWKISSRVGGAALLSGNLVRGVVVGLFSLRIGSVSTPGWSIIGAGAYALTIEINNNSVDYKHEDVSRLIISTQGIV